MIRTTLILLLGTTLARAGYAGDWTHYGGDVGGQRYVVLDQINAVNVDELQLAWQFRTGDAVSGEDHFGKPSSFKATPILFDGKLIFSTGMNRVFALDPIDGSVQWIFDPNLDLSVNYSEMFTSRGVGAWRDRDSDADCARRVLLGTLDARLIAIDARTGSKCRTFGTTGEIDLSQGVRNYRHGQYSLTSPVTVVNDVIVVGSSIGDNGAVELEPGTVRGFDAHNGALLWEWDPIPRHAKAAGASTWSPDGRARTGGANVWSIMSADAGRNLVFLPTTSPSPDFYGGKRRGNNLFANSVVSLDAATGNRVWHFQVVHHDLWDFDIASQPLLMDIQLDGELISAVLQATKMGHVFALHRDTGAPVFPVQERPVPQTDVPGEYTSPTQPFPVTPPPLHDGRVNVWEYSDEHAAYCRKLLQGVRYEGVFTPPSLEGTLLFPGNGGGANWGSMAADPERQLAFVAVNRMPTIVRLIPRGDFASRRRREGGGNLDVQFTSQSGTPFGMSRHEVFNPDLKLPCLEGPWGEVIALDMQHGEVAWRSPLGVFPGLEDHPQAKAWGSFASGGPIVTSSGLLFIANRYGRTLLALSVESGETLARIELPAMPTATPMSYEFGGRQFVVIAAGGPVEGTDIPGDYLLAFSLPSIQ